MEIRGGGGRRRINNEMSLDRSKASSFAPQRERERSLAAAARRAQVVYYLSRNGQLEHPHFLEISHLPNQFLRLKDVIERLTVLRGRRMPSLFSWSCKRSYKNGFVWNDLSENDVIYPADDAEYVLKGSEIIHGCAPPSLERFQHLQLSKKNTISLLKGRQVLEEEEQGEEDEMEKDVSGNYTTGDHTARPCNIAYTQCSRGVSTDEIALDDDSFPPSSSSDKPPTASAAGSRVASFRFENGDPVPDTVQLTRSSVLLHLISCGSVAVKGGRAAAAAAAAAYAGAPLAVSSMGRKSGGSLQREAAELQCMSENPRRVGNLQLEEKEYFSGSIVEGMTDTVRAAPVPSLKKSSSYNEERGAKLGIGEEEEMGSRGEERVRGKCIPGRRRTSAKQKNSSSRDRAGNQSFID